MDQIMINDHCGICKLIMFKGSLGEILIIAQQFNKANCTCIKQSLDVVLSENGLIAKRIEVEIKAFGSTGYISNFQKEMN